MSQVSELRKKVNNLAKEAGLKMSYWQSTSQTGQTVINTKYGVYDAEEHRPRSVDDCIKSFKFIGRYDERTTSRSSEYKALIEMEDWIQKYMQGEADVQQKSPMEDFEDDMLDGINRIRDLKRFDEMFPEHIQGTYTLPSMSDGFNLNERLLMVDEGKKELLQEIYTEDDMGLREDIRKEVKTYFLNEEKDKRITNNLITYWDFGKMVEDYAEDEFENEPERFEVLEFGDPIDSYIEENGMDDIVEWLKENDLWDDAIEKVKEDMYSDSEQSEWWWEDMTDNLTEFLKKYNPSGDWYAEVNNFGWRNQSGHGEFQAETGQEFLNAILPNTDCIFYIYDEGDHIHILNYHHDSPMGEGYDIWSKKTLKEKALEGSEPTWEEGNKYYNNVYFEIENLSGTVYFGLKNLSDEEVENFWNSYDEFIDDDSKKPQYIELIEKDMKENSDSDSGVIGFEFNGKDADAEWEFTE